MNRLRKLFAHIIPVAFSAYLIAVETVIHGRHDHRQIMGRGIAFDACAAHPDGMVVAVAVQKIKDLRKLVLF